MEYNDVFKTRAKSYASAMNLYKNVMLLEFQNAANILAEDLDSGLVINVPSGIDRIEEFLPKTIKYIPLEINDEFLKEDVDCKTIKCTLNLLPFDDCSVDRVLSLACLHHSTNEERRVFYKESFRVLKNNGRLIVGDVCKGSQQENWLNNFVDKYNSLGHKGRFFNEDDIDLIEKCGYKVETKILKYDWVFDSKEIMIDFCRKLFYLDKATDENIIHGIRDFFGVLPDADCFRLPWMLIYFIAHKL